MQVKTVSARFESLVNLGNYQNVKLGATVEVALDEGDTVGSASHQARSLAREQVAQELAALVKRQIVMDRVHYTGDATLWSARQKVAGMADGFFYLEMIAPDDAAAIVAPVHEHLMELEKAHLEEQERQHQEAAARGEAEPEGDELNSDEEGEDDNYDW